MALEINRQSKRLGEIPTQIAYTPEWPFGRYTHPAGGRFVREYGRTSPLPEALTELRMAGVGQTKVAGFGIAGTPVSTNPQRSGIESAMGKRLDGLTCPPGTLITGAVGYMNHLVPAGTETWAGFFLGKIEGDDFYLYYTTHEGVDYYIGSLASFSIVSPGSEGGANVPSVAAFTNPADLPYWDAWAWVGAITGTVRVLVMDARVVGIRREDLDFISPYDARAFEDALRVVPASEVTGFSLLPVY